MAKNIKITLLILLVILSKGAFSNVQSSQNPLLDKLKAFTRLEMERDKTPGAVVLLSSPKFGVKQFALGAAVLSDHNIKMTSDKNFRVASISKTFLAVMILKMVEQGKIHLYSNIKQYLPKDLDLSLIPNIDRVTVGDLLKMTSGIPEYYDLDVDMYLASYPYKQWRPHDALRFSSDLKAKFKPGRGYQYSNTNYVLLQLILRNITGQRLAQNLQTLICQPLGLKHTFADDFKMSAFTLTTKGYDTSRKSIDVSLLDDGFGVGDTFVITTASDLNTFIDALFVKKTLLKKETLKGMLKPSRFGSYGMGIEINYLDNWGNIYSHNGLVNGYQTNYFYIEQEQLTVIILTNNRSTKLIEPVLLKTLELYDQEIGHSPVKLPRG